MLPNGTAHDKWFTLFSFHFISSLHHFCLFWLHFAHRAPSVSFVVNYLARLLMILYVAFINPVTYGMRSILVSFITASLHLCNHKVAFEKRVWKFVQSVAILFVCVCVCFMYMDEGPCLHVLWLRQMRTTSARNVIYTVMRSALYEKVE